MTLMQRNKILNLDKEITQLKKVIGTFKQFSNIKQEAQKAEPVSLTCLSANKFQRRRFFNESANQKQDLSGSLVFLPLG